MKDQNELTETVAEVASDALLAAVKRLEPLAERWEETTVWHDPPFYDGRINIDTGDLKDIATVVRAIQAANVEAWQPDPEARPRLEDKDSNQVSQSTRSGIGLVHRRLDMLMASATTTTTNVRFQKGMEIRKPEPAMESKPEDPSKAPINAFCSGVCEEKGSAATGGENESWESKLLHQPT